MSYFTNSHSLLGSVALKKSLESLGIGETNTYSPRLTVSEWGKWGGDWERRGGGRETTRI